MSATVSNTGTRFSEATTLRYYRSTDAAITASDTSEGTAAIPGLNGGGTNSLSIALTAPASPGIWYYGACVDTVTGESATANNCSTAVMVTVRSPVHIPDLVVSSPTVSDNSPVSTGRFTLSATVSNTGTRFSEDTTLRYYRSTDAAITASDTEGGHGLWGDPLTAPASPGILLRRLWGTSHGACRSPLTAPASPVSRDHLVLRRLRGHGDRHGCESDHG